MTESHKAVNRRLGGREAARADVSLSAVISLVDALAGRTYEMQRLEGGAGAALRLEGLGLRPGVRIIKKAGLLSRGPVVIAIGNAEIAIGHGIAAKIIVKEITTGKQ